MEGTGGGKREGNTWGRSTHRERDGGPADSVQHTAKETSAQDGRGELSMAEVTWQSRTGQRDSSEFSVPRHHFHSLALASIPELCLDVHPAVYPGTAL